jgi:hypothetical protein
MRLSHQISESICNDSKSKKGRVMQSTQLELQVEFLTFGCFEGV